MRCILLGAATAFYSTYAVRGRAGVCASASVCAFGALSVLFIFCACSGDDNKKKGIRAVLALLTTTSTLMIATTTNATIGATTTITANN